MKQFENTTVTSIRKRTTNPFLFIFFVGCGIVVLCGLFFGIGYLVGKFTSTYNSNESSSTNKRNYLADLKAGINRNIIRNHLK